jgi:hypothetical protein
MDLLCSLLLVMMLVKSYLLAELELLVATTFHHLTSILTGLQKPQSPGVFDWA